MKSPLEDIVTPRLILRLIDINAINSLLEGKNDHAANLLNVDIPLELLDSPSSLNYSKKHMETDTNYHPWSARAIILKEQPQMVGIIRFHSSPGPVDLPSNSQWGVELGYRVFSSYRNKGYATEAVGAIMEWAQVRFGINCFVASVAPGNIPSNRLIASFGFVKVAEVIDDIDGLEYVYLRIT